MKAMSSIKMIESLAKTRILTCEGEIFSYLVEFGPSRPKDIIKNVSRSQVSVFNKLNEMHESGTLLKEQSLGGNYFTYRINDTVMNFILKIEIQVVNKSVFFNDKDAHSDIEILNYAQHDNNL
jgi:predicted transcriptional regulator